MPGERPRRTRHRPGTAASATAQATKPHAVVVGGTGLVGEALLQELSARQVRTTAIARRTGTPRMHVLWNCTDIGALEARDIPAGATMAFCALGTTIAVAGSQQAFRAVDHGLVLAFAKACRRAGIPAFALVSAAGADPDSRIFYNRVKGDVERDVAALGFPSLAILRPSLLLGKRQQRRRLERIGMAAMRVLRPLLPRRVRAVEATIVARALLRAAEEARPGVRIVGNREIHDLGRMA